MLHGISYKQVDNTAISKAYQRGASADYIATLKAKVSFQATIGYQYTEKPFRELAAILCNDYAYSPFRYKTIEEGATYNKEAFPHPYGGIRNKNNVTGKCTWLCLDVDTTNISIDEFHLILGNINHHLARTSNPDNQYKYRVVVPLTTPVDIDNEHWKFFIGSVAKYLQCNIDRLPKSQLLIGYANREVISKLDGVSIDPQPHIDMAIAQVNALNEERIDISPEDASKALQQPFCTFERGYLAENGQGSTMLISCATQAFQLGANKQEIIELVTSINNFWDYPMPKQRLENTIYSYIYSLTS